MQLGDIASLKTIAIRVGSVFRIECFPKDGVTPKNTEDRSRHKFIIIVGIDSEGDYIGATLINSDINKNLFYRIAQYQIELSSERYQFLNGKNRFIDCYKIITLDKKRILSDAKYVGSINTEDIKKIRELVKTSPIIDNNTIREFNL